MQPTDEFEDKPEPRPRPQQEVSNQPSWKRRRRVFGITMLFSATVIFWVMLRWDGDSLSETLALGAFGLWASVVAAYSGFATWEDIKLQPQQRQRDDYYDRI